LIRLVGQAGANPGPLLDEDLVPVRDERAHPGRRHADAELASLDLFGYTDQHVDPPLSLELPRERGNLPSLAVECGLTEGLLAERPDATTPAAGLSAQFAFDAARLTR